MAGVKRNNSLLRLFLCLGLSFAAFALPGVKKGSSNMKIIYEFATDAIEIEVDETYYDILIEFEREEKNLNRKHERRYPISLQYIDYEGMDFADGVDVLEDYIKYTDREELQKAIERLLPAQQDLIKRVFFHESSIVSIAREEGVTEAAVRDRLKRIYKKLKKVLK